MTETDVVVIGAGAAGLSAGVRLAELGLGFVVVEAKNRVGGRAFTDRDSVGLPFDQGCHWLHSASVNPFRAIADRLGFHYERRTTRRSRQLILKDVYADAAEKDAAWDTIEAIFAAGEEAGREGRDVALSEVADFSGPYGALAFHWTGLMSSQPPDRISTLDLSRYSDSHENFPVGDGYGDLVAAYARGVPVSLGVRAMRVDWSGSGVVVTTTAGTIRARAVIVTLPTNVLAAGALSFMPALPIAMMEAIAACPCGHAEKAIIRFARPLADLPETSYIDTFDPSRPDRPPINFVINPFGLPLAVGQLGGPMAAALEAAGTEAMVDFALAALVDAFGADIRREVVATTATGWASDPDIRGAYSCALPGKADLRARLSDVVGERVLLAGEAVPIDSYSTAHGAHLSGLAAADRAAALIAAAAGTAGSVAPAAAR